MKKSPVLLAVLLFAALTLFAPRPRAAQIPLASESGQTTLVAETRTDLVDENH